MAYLPILIYHKFMPNVGKYTFRPMKPVMENSSNHQPSGAKC